MAGAGSVIMSMGVVLLLAACATPAPPDPALQFIDQSRLPASDVSVAIPGLGPCTDNPDRTLKLASGEPLTVLVHGCFSSAGRFRGLAQVLAFHGQQTACFTYNDRDSLVKSSNELGSALAQLSAQMKGKQIAVVGHSQGALIARKAMVAEPAGAGAAQPALRLVTVSGPFAGIAAANSCGNPTLRVLSLGLVGPICQLVTGSKWSEITYTSPFILQPGRLGSHVQDFLKVETDERGSCRRVANGACAESDAIFSLAEQRNAVVDSDPRVKIIEVKAGHVEIVGDTRVAPAKLIAILQENDILRPTEPARMEKLGQLLTALYGSPSGPVDDRD
jgi:pimeloyl-ACP methyl ester carboxylesterase